MLKMCAVRNSEGKWLTTGYITSSYSYAGYWSTELYYEYLNHNLRGAETLVTKLANAYPDQPIAEVVEFEINIVKVHSQVERIEERREVEKEKELRRLAKIES